MKLSKRKRKLIIRLCTQELEKSNKDKGLKKDLRSIVYRMTSSIEDTEKNKDKA